MPVPMGIGRNSSDEEGIRKAVADGERSGASSISLVVGKKRIWITDDMLQGHEGLTFDPLVRVVGRRDVGAYSVEAVDQLFHCIQVSWTLAANVAGARSRREFSPGQSLPASEPNPRLRPKLQSTPPSGINDAGDCRPSFCSSAGHQGTSWKASPLSITAKRPELKVTRWRWTPTAYSPVSAARHFASPSFWEA